MTGGWLEGSQTAAGTASSGGVRHRLDVCDRLALAVWLRDAIRSRTDR